MAADDNTCCAIQMIGNKSESLTLHQTLAVNKWCDWDSRESVRCSVDWIRPAPEAARSVSDN